MQTKTGDETLKVPSDLPNIEGVTLWRRKVLGGRPQMPWAPEKAEALGISRNSAHRRGACRLSSDLEDAEVPANSDAHS